MDGFLPAVDHVVDSPLTHAGTLSVTLRAGRLDGRGSGPRPSRSMFDLLIGGTASPLEEGRDVLNSLFN